ncbi:MAG: restriction endonuclease subunit S, partial [Gammaproteobacteria bacterium]
MPIKWEIPSSWSLVKLGEIAPENSSQIIPSNSPDQVFNYWGLDAIDKGNFEEPPPNYIRGNQVSSTCVKFDTSHILYAKLRPYLNKVIVPTQSGIGSTEWIPLKPDPSRLDRNFLAFALRTSRFVDYAQRNSTGARMPRVRKVALWNADIPIPYPEEPERSLAEQRRIVARIEALLAEVREMRKLHDEITADANKLMDAVRSEAFYRGKPLPAEWEYRSLEV